MRSPLPAPQPLCTLTAGLMPVAVYRDPAELGLAAAAAVGAHLRELLATRDTVRYVLATGNSQIEFTKSLLADTGIEWRRIECFHMDEYVGIRPDHPASFRRWMRERVETRVHPRAFHYIEGDSPDPEAECKRYARLLSEAPIDLITLGIGENGHIAFNDPPVADFDDPKLVKIVRLDEACKQQQVGEGHFPDLLSVPTHAITLTIPALVGASRLFCLVPEGRKARAVRDTVKGPIATSCPASILRRFAKASFLLDGQSAGLIL
jgi:glucosamine-6-phosphate deaminase